MSWQSAADFWAMGGYAVYVWGSVGVSAALLALEVLLARHGRQQALGTVCEAMQTQDDAHRGRAARQPTGEAP